MSGQATLLLSALHAAGVQVAVGVGNTLELTGKRPPAALLDEVRASKAALLDVLEQGHRSPAPAPQRAPYASPSPVSDPLPDHLARLVSAAKAGTLPSGPVNLASGLVPDLGVYVLAWAECWPRDRAHVSRRLEEAHAACVGT